MLSVGTTLYHYTTDGQLDCRGTTVSGTCPSGSDSFRWDGAGALSSTTVGGKSVCYRFGPDGSLASRLYDSTVTSSCATAPTTTNYLLGDLFETSASGTITTSNQDGPSGDVASFNGAPTTSSTPTYLYYNGHGDLAAEAGAAGTPTAAHSYDPFGAAIGEQTGITTNHRYTGEWDKQNDTTTGLILMGARPYDPTIGRFFAVDPVDGGSLNGYDYAGQDPINGYDLLGTRTDDPAGENEVRDVGAVEQGDSIDRDISDRRGSPLPSTPEWGWKVQEGEFAAPEDVQTAWDRLQRSGFKLRPGQTGGSPI